MRRSSVSTLLFHSWFTHIDSGSHFMFDTPGQIEIFYMVSGTIISDAVTRRVMAYVVDNPRTGRSCVWVRCSVSFSDHHRRLTCFLFSPVTAYYTSRSFRLCSCSPRRCDIAIEWMQEFEVLQAVLASQWGLWDAGGELTYANKVLQGDGHGYRQGCR